ncbi:hypothetical protein Tco_0683669 [Tanacetum coccineum]
MDDELVAPADHFKIGKSDLRLSSTLKSKEPTLQVVLDALKLTPFYNAFEISTDVPEIYMQEFWVIISRHHSSLRFKLNGKSHTVNVDNFRDMLKIYPKLPGQKFEEPPLKEDILSFIKDLGHTGEIKFLFYVNVNHMHQPWRSFAAIINKCLSGKTTTLENLAFQVEKQETPKKNNDMYYPRFTKVIVDYFMAKDQAIPRRNKMFWHHARDDFMFTTIRVISKHRDTQVYGAILPQHLTNQAMLESEAYMTYQAYATVKRLQNQKPQRRKLILKYLPRRRLLKLLKEKESSLRLREIKLPRRSNPHEHQWTKVSQALSSVAFTELSTEAWSLERSKTQTHSSHASSSSADEGTGVKPGVPDVLSYNSDDEQISWKSSDEEDDDEVSLNDDDDDVANQDDENQDDDNKQTDSDNDGDDFVHPKFSTHDDDAKQDEEVNEEDSFDPRVQTPSHVESSDDERNEESDEEVQGANTEEEEMEEEATHEDDEANELYRDVNVNLEGRHTAMTDAPLPNSSSVSSGFVSNMLNPRPDTGIDSLFNLNTEATSLVDVLVTTIVEPPLVFATTLPPPPTLLITHMQQTPVPTPTTISSSSTQNLPNFVSSIPNIVDAYLANKMNDAVMAVVQLQSDRLRDEAQAKNKDFLNKLDDNIKK